MPGNEKWAKGKPDAEGQSETLIETRGEGGYVILAPSFNGTYSMVTGGVESIVTISSIEREELKAVAAKVCENPEPEKPKADEPAERTPEQKAAAKKKREAKRAKEIADAAAKAVAEERARIAAETPKE